MNDFKHIFITESKDIISYIENDLIELEKDLSNETYVHDIFRHLHTIKGGAYMLALQNLGSFIHELETIYDLIREGAKKLNDQILDLTFQAVDHIKKLLQDPELEDEFLRASHTKMMMVLKGLQAYDQVFEKVIPEGQTNFIYYLLIKPDAPLPSDTEHPVIYILEELEDKHAHSCLKKHEDEEGIHFWLAIIDFIHEKDELEAFFLFLRDDIKVTIEELADSKSYELNETVEEKLDSWIKEANTPPSLEEVRQLFAKFSKPKTKSIPQESSTDSENEFTIDTNSVGSTRVSLHKVNRLMNAVSELITLNSALKNISAKYQLNDLNLISEKIELEINHLREDVFSMNLLPLSTLNTQFKRMVRDISRTTGKDVHFEMLGGDTELDKYMIDSLKNPLLHILRNSIDHGIEDKAERLKRGKDEEGQINLRGYYSGTDVVIEIQDDGGGIDTVKVREKALSQGIIQADEELSENELLKLICHPGLSTAQKVTDLSGRGVGMNVVKETIDSLRGNLEISTNLHEGTTFSIRLPLTLSIINGLLVEVEDTQYIVPMFSIDRIYRVPVKSIERGQHFSSLVDIEGQQVAIINLHKEFQGNSQNHSSIKEMDVIMLSNQRKLQAIAVDRIEGEIQAMVKPIGQYFHHQKYILGSSVLGDGSLALVLDTNKLVSQFHSLN